MVVDKLARLHHGGTDKDNPILEGQTLRIKLHKQNHLETLRKAWVTVGNDVFYDLTSAVVSTRETLYVDVTAGVELQADFPAVQNKIHFTTSDHRHARRDLFVATRPAAMITLDGYNASNPLRPFIYPLYLSAGS